jgi:hypothetical protein
MKLHEITFENWAQKRGDVPLFLTTDDNLIFKWKSFHFLFELENFVRDCILWSSV